MPKNKGGRPDDYTPETADRICARLAQGQSLRAICRDDDMPSVVTVFAWMRKYPEFLKRYTQAKEESADALSDEMIEIADDARNDWMDKVNADGEVYGQQVNSEHVQRSRLRIETRKWLASKLKPKKYGDKLGLTDGNGEPITFKVLVDRDTAK